MQAIEKINSILKYIFIVAVAMLLAGIVSSCAKQQPVEIPNYGTGEETALVRAYAEPATVKVGEKTTYHLVTVGKQGVVFEMSPELLKVPLDPLEVVANGTTQLGTDKFGRAVTDYWFTLRHFEVGKVALKPIEVKYATADGQSNTAQTEAVTIEVVSVLPKDLPESADIKDIAGLLRLPPSYAQWLVFALLLLTTAVLGWLAVRFYKSRPEKPAPTAAAPTDTRTPWERALDSLRALEAQRLFEQGGIERFYVEVSAIVRRYVEERFGVHAPEQTTEEFLSEIAHKGILGEQPQRLMQDFLLACDMVKFARYQPTAVEYRDVLTAAYRIIEETTPAPAPAVAVETEKVESV